MFSKSLYQTKIKYILKKAEKYECYSTDYDNYVHKSLIDKCNNKQIQVIQTCFNFEEIIPIINKKKKYDYDDIMCGYYYKNNFNEGQLSFVISDAIDQKKTIFIISDYTKYYVDIENDNEYWHHSTCIIFEYVDKKNYNLFYINSHGNALINYKKYYYKITRKRTKEYTFNEPVEIAFLKSFASHIQQYVNSLDLGIDIHYNETKSHNYYGFNLQCADNYGICFAFPLVILNYVKKYYNKKRKINNWLIIPSIKILLNNKNIIKFVTSCFIDYNEKIKKYFINHITKKYSKLLFIKPNYKERRNYYNKFNKLTNLNRTDIKIISDIEQIIEKSNTIFVKFIVGDLVMQLINK